MKSTLTRRALDLVTAGGHAYIKDHLLHRITRDNCLVIINYVLGLMTEVNPSQDYRLNTIGRLKHLAEHYNPKSFRELTREDIVAYLDSFRKPESVDPLHKWIGTYELTRIMLLRFFRWLNAPDVEGTMQAQACYYGQYTQGKAQRSVNLQTH